MKNLRAALFLTLLSIMTLDISATETPKSNDSGKIDDAAVNRITSIVTSCLINSNTTDYNTCRVVILFTVNSRSMINFVNVIGDNPVIAGKIKDTLENYKIKYSNGAKNDMVYILPIKLSHDLNTL